MAANESTAGLVKLAVQRSCGDHWETPAKPGAVVMFIVSGILVLLGATSELLSYRSKRATQVAAKGSASINGEEMPLIATPNPAGSKSSGHSTGQSRVLWYFNPSNNLTELFSVTGARSLSGLDGLKGFSMLWIILGHTSLFTSFIGTTNPSELKNLGQLTSSYFVLSAVFAVDTFFLVSGLLTSYVLASKLRKMKKGLGLGKFFLFVLLRWLRLTPLFSYLLFTYAYVAPVAAKGPFWYKMVYETGFCEKYWWTNLLYINNFVPVNYHEQCIAWSWYLANDVQFYIVSLIIMFVYLRSPKVGSILAVTVTLVSVAIGYYLTSAYNLGEESNEYQDVYYDKPYTRIPPYTIGLLIGVALRDTQLKNIRLSGPASVLAQLGCVGSIIFIMYIQGSRYNATDGYDEALAPLHEYWTKSDYAAYNSLGRLFYSLALGGVCILNATGNGGMLHSFLTLPFWEPLGKLTFGAYLIHPILLRIYYYQLKDLYEFGYINVTVTFVAIATLSYGMSMITYVLIELPFDSLVKSALGLNRR